MLRQLAVCGVSIGLATPAAAQTWAPWHQPSLIQPSRPPKTERRQEPANPSAQRPASPRSNATPTLSAPVPQRTASVPKSPALLDGGPQPGVSPSAPGSVAIKTGHGAGTIVIDTSARRLYLMQSQTSALSYPISVGRVGFTWTGTERISRVASWPDWRPPSEMRARQPGLPEVMTGGIRNPLGAKALYLGNSLYRIHGTNSERSVGEANSSGCFRMTNGHVVDLANRVGSGTTVVVKSRL